MSIYIYSARVMCRTEDIVLYWTNRIEQVIKRRQKEKFIIQKNNVLKYNPNEETKSKKQKEKCIIRESNTGLVDGNDEFYH